MGGREKGPLMGKLQNRIPYSGLILPGTQMIPLTQGQYTKVSDDWYEVLMTGPLWYAHWNSHTKSFYAERNVRRADGTWTTEQMHRLITGFRWRIVDHINHDTLDNLPPNMRDGTPYNNRNRTPQGGTSQYHGVSWRKDRRKWRAQIMVDGVKKHLGYFDSELDAAIAYDEASLKYHGAHGTRNFPGLAS